MSFISNIQELSNIKKSLYKGEEYFTSGITTKIVTYFIYIVLCGIFICYILSKNNWAIPTSTIHLVLICVVPIISLIPILFFLYGDCIAFENRKIKKWTSFYSYQEYDIKSLKSVVYTTEGDNTGIFLIEHDNSVQKIDIQAYDKKQVEKIVSIIKLQIEQVATQKVADEFQTINIEPTAKEQAKQVGKYALIQLLRAGIKIGLILLAIGILYLLK